MSEKCSVICGNALDQDYTAATAFFLYLVPRGLRLMLPILLSLKKPLRIVTYMSPLPGINADNIIKIATASHPGAEWPLFVYYIDGSHTESVLGLPQQLDNAEDES